MTCLTWPGSTLDVAPLASESGHVSGQLDRVTVLGLDGELQWTRDADGLHVSMPDEPPCRYAQAMKVELEDGQ